MTHIVKATSKGQITLPAAWRRHVKTDRFILKEKTGRLEIVPMDLKKMTAAFEYTVFDAIRDNKGKGVPIEKMMQAIRETL